MPHCTKPLYSNVLWANWSLDNLQLISIIGNSFIHYNQRYCLSSLPSFHLSLFCACINFKPGWYNEQQNMTMSSEYPHPSFFFFSFSFLLSLFLSFSLLLILSFYFLIYLCSDFIFIFLLFDIWRYLDIQLRSHWQARLPWKRPSTTSTCISFKRRGCRRAKESDEGVRRRGREVRRRRKEEKRIGCGGIMRSLLRLLRLMTQNLLVHNKIHLR